jgi:hypothetical protein
LCLNFTGTLQDWIEHVQSRHNFSEPDGLAVALPIVYWLFCCFLFWLYYVILVWPLQFNGRVEQVFRMVPWSSWMTSERHMKPRRGNSPKGQPTRSADHLHTSCFVRPRYPSTALV